jgi:hypothetical protein
MDEDFTREDLFRIIDRVIEDLLSAAGIIVPPVDAVALARDHLGMDLDAERPRRRGQRGQAETLAPTEQARQWEVALAVGARLKPAVLQRLDLTPEQGRSTGGPSLATLLASHLLAPTDWFAGDARRLGYDVPELQRLYHTAGVELLAWRLLDLPQPCVITLVDDGHVRKRRSNAGRVRAGLEDAERDCQRFVHNTGRPRVVRSGGWSVQGWPLPPPEAKRLILRSVREDD